MLNNTQTTGGQPRKHYRSQAGLTILELLIAVAGIALLTLVCAHFLIPLGKFFSHSHARQRANRDTRVCLETIAGTLTSGRASTLATSTPNTTPTVQSSQADFVGLDGLQYRISWSNSPLNSVHLQRGPVGGAFTMDSILATNITALYFIIDSRDPAMVNVTLRSTTPLDATGIDGSFETIFLQNRMVRMNAF